MRTVTASYLRTHSAQVFAEIERTREAIVVTKRGRPVARVVPVGRLPRSAYGSAKGQILGEFTEDLFSTGAAWEADTP